MIRNRDKGTVLCESYELAESAWQKTKGLMFRKEMPENHGMLMTFSGKGKPGIWMMGMKFPIDIVFMDSRKEVIRVVENAQPMGFSWRSWRIFSPPVSASYVLELPAGTAGKSKTLVGDTLEF